MDLLKSIESAGKITIASLSKNSPEVVSALGVSSFLLSVIWAVKATPDAIERKKAAEEEKEDKLTPIEVVKNCGTVYLPSIAMFGIGTACIVQSNRIYSKRVTALATAATLSETAFREYREQVIETMGEKKEKALRDEIADKQIKENPPTNKEVLMIGNGEILCYEPISKKYFRTTVNDIGKAKNDLNAALLLHNYVSVNDYLELLGINGEPEFDDIGWSCYSASDFVDISYGHKLADDYTPVLVVSLSRQPEYGYNIINK